MLEVFKAVVNKGSFVKAADSLNLSKAVATHAIQELEARLGTQLLQRSTRRLSLTATGQTVLEHAQQLLDSYEALAAIGSANATEVAGDICLIAPVSYGARHLGAPLASFVAKYPKVQIDLRLANGTSDVIEERADLALCLTANLPSTLISRKVSSAAVGLFASPRYLDQRGTPRHPRDLREHDCLTYDYDGEERIRQWRFVHCGKEGEFSHPARGVLNCNDGDALVSAATHGAGIARLPLFIVESAVTRGELMPVLEDWRIDPLDVKLVYATRRNQPLRVRKLIDHLALALNDSHHVLPRPKVQTMASRMATGTAAMHSPVALPAY